MQGKVPTNKLANISRKPAMNEPTNFIFLGIF
jgi:hypothetical protein